MVSSRSTSVPSAHDGHEPPHSLELEHAIISVVVKGSHAVAMQQIRPLAQHPLLFWNRNYRLIWLACLDIDDQAAAGTGASVHLDATALVEHLGRWRFSVALDRLRQLQLASETEDLDTAGRQRLRQFWRLEDRDRSEATGDSVLAAIGGARVIYDLADAPGSFASLTDNGRILRDLYLRRRFIARLDGIIDEAYLTTDRFGGLVDRAGQTVMNLSGQNDTTTVHDMSTVADETLSIIHHRMNNPDRGVATGLPDIDEKLGALRPGGLYVLAARPGVGKTSLALRMVQSIVTSAANPQQVLFFSLEVSSVDLAKKLIAAYGQLPFSDLDSGKLSEELLPKLEQCIVDLRSWPLDISENHSLTVHALRSIVKRHMLEKQGAVKLVVIDYLQLLSASNPGQEEYAKISEITRVLKVVALELKIPILALSQMSRDSEKGTAPREPRLSDLRGSGSIEQDADAVIFIHRMDGEDGDGPDAFRNIKLRVAKNRFGPTGDMLMRFYPARLTFEAATPEPGGEDDDPAVGSGGGGRGRVTRAAEDRGQRLKQKPGAGEDLFADDAETP
jgi:replicative DNA helicase